MHVRKYSKDFSSELVTSSSKLNWFCSNADGRVKSPFELKVLQGENSVASLFRIVKNPFVPIIISSVILGAAYELIIEAVIPLSYFNTSVTTNRIILELKNLRGK